MMRWIARLLRALNVRQEAKGRGTVQIAALHGDLTIVKLIMPTEETAWSHLAELIDRRRKRARARKQS